ncbi:hypothetical protein [Gemmata sp.]|uniref:hypothetical protein n=1 Tax=Gemmata sp. TaxID=1914242 RepID=UPI003F6F03FE
MPEGLLKAAITALSTLIVLALAVMLGRLVGGGVTKEQDRIVMRYGDFVRGLGAIGTLITIASLIGYVVDLFTQWLGPQKGNVNVLLLGACIAGFFTVPLLFEIQRREIVLTEEGIIHRGFFGTDPLIRWDDITKIENMPIASTFFVNTARKRLGVNYYMAGLKLFEAECKKWLQPGVYGDAFGR